MADAKRRAKLGAAVRGQENVVDPEAKNELDDTEKQAAILEPKPIETTVGGRPISLYELPAKRARQFAGLVAQVMSSVVGQPGSFIGRLNGILSENETFSDRFVGFVARATFPPNASFEQLANLEPIKAEIDESATFGELAVLFSEMVAKNGTLEAFNRPK